MNDALARSEAVQPQRSIIVQAPAGSGKTTLLVERYLGLLAVVDAPEEILAITFTRKAAAEMRQRVLRYLHPHFQSDLVHEQGPLRKAQAVQDKVREWHLLENPQRLLIRTIDSFNHYLARTMPVASALGPVPAPADNAKALYRQAARNVLALMDSQHQLAPDIERLLDWRDHRSQDVENLLAELLGKRDQWLRALNITGLPQRTLLETVLYDVVTNQLSHATEILHSSLDALGTSPAELTDLLRFAADTLAMQESSSVIRAFAAEHDLPDMNPDSLPRWKGLAEIFLTGKDEFRKSITKAIGLPAKTEQKVRFQALLDAVNEDILLRDALSSARRMPVPQYSDEDWSVLDALVRVLRQSAAELELVFARSGQTDYTGLAAAALRGLGDEDSGYTDLGLYLDQRIQHVLVDEFQDTNWGQLHLLEKLTAGWQPDDGRSLFLVGDPMQSIYRFREAEVGLFIRSRDFGVGPLTLEDKRLALNFRSRQEIVQWVNDRLGPIFPDTENISAGAVAYTASQAGRSAGGKVEVLAHPNEADEAEAIVQLAARAISEHAADPGYKAAIIVRARSHLREILPALARHQLAYRAVKLDPLTSRPVVQDLLSLTRAITQPADTTALLAILRSPVCGLTLCDLHALAGDRRSLQDHNATQRLDPLARGRAERVFTALDSAQQQWRRRTLRDLVEGTWRHLGGPACCLNIASDLRDAEAYLDALELAADNGLLEDWNDFLELLDGSYTEGDPASEDVKLEILTMHGAKGLEWDMVILPALHKGPGGRDNSLLHWLPFTDARGDEQVLFAPLRAAEQAKDSPLVELIRNQQKTRAAFENQRLLYVASTRAKEQLVLSACLNADAEEVKPMSGSLLADLWPSTHQDFLAALGSPPANSVAVIDQSGNQATPNAPATSLDQTLRRIATDWHPPLEPAMQWVPALPPKEQDFEIEYNWAGMLARRTGTVLHRLLEHVGNVGIENLNAIRRDQLIKRIPVLLQAAGTRAELVAPSALIIRDAFTQTLDSDTGRWMLNSKHPQASCELRVSGMLGGQLINAVIDRTFIDEHDVRWIIDYKSGYHAGADVEVFLNQESERYRAQLGRYRQLFEQLETRQIRTALYLPRHGKLQIV